MVFRVTAIGAPVGHRNHLPPASPLLDTNVLVAALRSNQGASFQVLSLVSTGAFDLAISVPLLFEYEDVLSRAALQLDQTQTNAILDYLCAVALHQPIHFLWRSHLKDPKDDHVLELAFNAQCPIIVAFNLKDFKNATKLGIQALTPKAFLSLLGAQP